MVLPTDEVVAVYVRVSSDEQREHQTIKTQEEAIERFLQLSGFHVYAWYRDDGVSGTIPMGQRPAGSRLLRDAALGCFTKVLVFKIDRLGRDDIDPLIVWRDLERLGVTVISITEGVSSLFDYHMRIAMAAEERRTFLARSAAGMERAARDGRYCGGIVPIGYRVEGKKPNARLVSSDKIAWQDWTEQYLVQRIYQWLAIERWSCVQIATHLNALGVPTVYARDGILLKDEYGKRTKHTQGKWRAGRISNLVKNPVYKGEYHYGRRSRRVRETIVSKVPALVMPEIWQAAQDALRANRLMTKNAGRVYLLRSLIHCSTCRLTYTGTPGRDGLVWYRCGGQIVRGSHDQRCAAKSFRGDWIEPLVVEDVTRWLENPGEIVEELKDGRDDRADAVAAAERQVIEERLSALPHERDRMLEAYRRDLISVDDLGKQLEAIAEDEHLLHERLATLDSRDLAENQNVLEEDLVEEIRCRVREGLSPELWREVLALLVSRIDVSTEVIDARTKKASITIRYRFPGVVNHHPGTGSSRRRA